MSLASRIIFATSMSLCAVLCIWAALAFGGPGATAMWVVAGVCILVSVVAMLIKSPRSKALENFRVEGAREPTFRLIHAEKGGKDEIWQLVLGRTRCELIRPDGTVATTFARKWAEMAIRLPGFVRGEHLGIVTEDWTPPDDRSGITVGEVIHAAKNIRRWDDADAPYYWFSAPKELIREIEDYQRRTKTELGAAEAAGPIGIKARQVVLSGAVGLGVGLAVLPFGVMRFMEQDGQPGGGRVRLLALGAVISLIGLWRLGQGILLYRGSRS
jgi:hypothetical protein